MKSLTTPKTTLSIRCKKVSFSINQEASENTGLRIYTQSLQPGASVGSPGM